MLLQLTEARSKLQGAINESHPAPPAKYLRESAAACLLYGLQSVPSGFHMNAVLCTQVTRHVNAKCPDKPCVMERLHLSKYFKVVELPGIPDQFLLDLHAIIMRKQLPQVTDILASINPMHPEPQQPPQISNISPDPDQLKHTRLTASSWVRQSAASVRVSQCQVTTASQMVWSVAGCSCFQGLVASCCLQKPWFPHSRMVEGNCCCMH